ncbi:MULTISPECIES: GMC family oxidoreductase [unclassified Mesorhizobium]|uniref:FAD-dependent oxidoreductase n=1 Tax=unclassified Mesorhizobium TaxID=325217 RepID=UPI0015E2C048|nr:MULTISPECIES: GMC family oxidoreductase [unclassified Mesorhizobium]
MANQDLVSRTWDVIVVGTGIGGATLGYAMAKAGRSVLFVEQGRSYLHDTDVIEGNWLESLTAERGGPTADEKFRAGRFDGAVVDISTGQPRTMRPMLGTGTGGSSAIYGMVMERFFPADFMPGRYFRGVSGANVPDSWPISYEDLAPHYAEAETLYGVRATPDPLHPEKGSRGVVEPPPLTRASAELVERFRAKGLHPYRLPMACEYVPDCRECIGFICEKRCKHDSATACLEPALRLHGAQMLTECTVRSLESENGQIGTVTAGWRGQKLNLRGRTVVLAAGALRTPGLLLRSGSHGVGLANGSGQVGRNLMRHFIDYYILYPRAAADNSPMKQIALNDFYIHGGQKLGTLQSNGKLPPVAAILNGYREELRRKWAPLAAMFPLVRPLAAQRLESMLLGGHVMTAFMEDPPYLANRVTLGRDGETLQIRYRIAPADQRRLDLFRGAILSALRPHRVATIFRANQNGMLGHGCGTCRFGDDPRTSVLDRNNRAHEIENLYVVDASFLPTSSGTNPSLTVAANALRVAKHLVSISR